MDNRDFTIKAETITDAARLIHNEIDENGDIREDAIMEVLEEQFLEVFRDWAESEIKWHEIEDADKDLVDFVRERNEASKGNY